MPHDPAQPRLRDRRRCQRARPSRPAAAARAFRCRGCGHRIVERAPFYRCPECRGAGTFALDDDCPPERGGAEGARPPAHGRHSDAHAGRPQVAALRRPTLLGQVSADALPRHPSGLHEVDRVFGQSGDGSRAGLAEGQVALLGGAPGVGKSTLLAQVLDGLTASGGRALYASGEESAAQIAARCRRLGLTGLLERADVLATHGLADVEAALDAGRYRVAVLDSVQTVSAPAVTAAAGSAPQLKAVCERLTARAKGSGTILLLVGQATKDGQLAGPQAAAHVVDTLLWMDRDRAGSYRTLCAPKNRFGPDGELAVLQMHAQGLRGVEDPSARFAAHRAEPAPGSSWTVLAEQARPIATELQALVTGHGSGRQVATGLDTGRVALLAATLQRAGVALEGEVFVDYHGVRASERACDLPLVLALASSALGRALGAGTVAFGELTLTGQLRMASRSEARLNEAARLGFTDVLSGPLPEAVLNDARAQGLRVRAAASLHEALRIAWGPT